MWHNLLTVFGWFVLTFREMSRVRQLEQLISTNVALDVTGTPDSFSLTASLLVIALA